MESRSLRLSYGSALPTELTAKDISICGAANLIAALFEESPAKVYRHLGLAPPTGYCWQCGLEVAEKGTGLCLDCQKAAAFIQVACSYCGALTRRRASAIVLFVSRYGYQHFFCSRHCMGMWAAQNYGFTAHPENRGKRKYDYDMVWQKHLETGFGAIRLGRLLGMKTDTVNKILQAKRKEMKAMHALK